MGSASSALPHPVGPSFLSSLLQPQVRRLLRPRVHLLICAQPLPSLRVFWPFSLLHPPTCLHSFTTTTETPSPALPAASLGSGPVPLSLLSGHCGRGVLCGDSPEGLRTGGGAPECTHFLTLRTCPLSWSIARLGLRRMFSLSPSTGERGGGRANCQAPAPHQQAFQRAAPPRCQGLGPNHISSPLPRPCPQTSPPGKHTGCTSRAPPRSPSTSGELA